MGFEEDTSALNRMTIQAVGELLGIKLPLQGMTRCPFLDHDDGTPSFEVKTSGNRWECYGCNRRGGSIDFVKTYHHTEFLEAKTWLMDHAGLTPTAAYSGRRRNQSMPLSVSARPPVIELTESSPDYEIYEDLLLRAPLQLSGNRYLRGRGLLEKTISTFRIGQILNSGGLLRDLISMFGFSRVEASGLLTKHSTIRNPRFLFPDGSIVFPFLEHGVPAYLQARIICEEADRGKWRNLNHRRLRIYNLDQISEADSRPFAICEGVMDTLSAIELGYRAIGLMGVAAKLNDEQIKRLRGSAVDILVDWDSPGERKAAELQKQMRKFGITSNRKRRPSSSVKDLNEYLMETRGL